jgi:hypothetical protein
MDPMNVPLERLIEERYPIGEWATTRELGRGTGAVRNPRYIDVAAFGCWPSKGFPREAFECKRSRGDFVAELKQPDKRKWVEEAFHKTWFVTSHGIVKSVDEIPESWGWMEASKNGRSLRAKKQPMVREVGKLKEPLALAMIRNIAKQMEVITSRTIRIDGTEVTNEELEKLVQQKLSDMVGVLQKQTKRATEMQQIATQERTEMTAALQHLASLTSNYHETRQISVTYHNSDKVRVVTVADVNRWLELAVAARLRKTNDSLKSAHNALGDVLKGLSDDASSGEGPGRR